MAKKQKTKTADKVKAAAVEVTKTPLQPRAFFAPQLPVTVDAPPEGEGWLNEFKLDGHRTSVSIDHAGGVWLLSRTRNNVTRNFPLVASELAQLQLKDTYLDGEIVVPREVIKSVKGEKTKFYLTSASDIPSAIKWKPESIELHLFDIVYHDGEDLRSKPQSERKKILQKLLENAPPHVRYVEHFEGGAIALFKRASKLGFEGIVSKRATAGYHTGQSRNWTKIKSRKEQEFVILGYTGITHLRSLVIGYYEGNQLKIAGKVRYGFSGEIGRGLYDLLKVLLPAPAPLSPHKEYGGTIWVEPRLIAQVSYLNWREGRTLESATFLHIRDDKNAPDVVKEPISPKQNSRQTIKRAAKSLAPGET